MWSKLDMMADELRMAVERMDSNQWIGVSVVAMVLGALCLRGFGSRTNY